MSTDTRPPAGPLVDRIAQAIGDPGSIVGRKYGPSWGEGSDGYAPDEETVTRWSTRAVVRVMEEAAPHPDRLVELATAVRSLLAAIEEVSRIDPPGGTHDEHEQRWLAVYRDADQVRAAVDGFELPPPSTVLGHEGQHPAIVKLAHEEVERSRRREWVAALRYAAAEIRAFVGTVANPKTLAGMAEDGADLIEAGLLIPWADTPEPEPRDDSFKASVADLNQPTAPATATSPGTSDRDQRIAEEHHEIAGGRIAEAARDATATPPGREGVDPHPGTPEGSAAVLGRALLGHYGVPVMVEDEQGNWGSGFVRPVPRAEAVEMFAAREVLLVSPAAGKVLEAAHELAAAARANVKLPILGTLDRAQRLQDAERAVCAAVDALVGDHPTKGINDDLRWLVSDKRAPVGDHPVEPTPEPAKVVCGCGVRIMHATADGYGKDGCDDPDPGSEIQHLHEDLAAAEQRAEAAEDRAVTADAWRQWTAQPAPSSVAADTTETTPDQRGLYGKFRVERVDGRDQPGGDKAGAAYFVLDYVHDPYARVALAAYGEACAEGYPALAADLRARVPSSVAADLTSPSLEPDSGPGWHRDFFAAFVENCDPDSAQQITALLADRDHQAGLYQAEHQALEAALVGVRTARAELTDARAEVEEVTADRNRLRLANERLVRAGEVELDARAEVERLRAEVETAWNAAGDMKAIEERAAADRAEVERLRGERADLDKIARDASVAAHRDGAADALEWAAAEGWSANLGDLSAKVRTGEVQIKPSNEEGTPDA